MSTITNPGDAMRTAMALLRHQGYGAVDVSADWVPDTDKKVITVQGWLTSLQSNDDLGMFRGTATTDGRVTLKSGAFGRIDSDGNDDPFYDL